MLGYSSTWGTLKVRVLKLGYSSIQGTKVRVLLKYLGYSSIQGTQVFK